MRLKHKNINRYIHIYMYIHTQYITRNTHCAECLTQYSLAQLDDDTLCVCVAGRQILPSDFDKSAKTVRSFVTWNS